MFFSLQSKKVQRNQNSTFLTRFSSSGALFTTIQTLQTLQTFPECQFSSFFQNFFLSDDGGEVGRRGHTAGVRVRGRLLRQLLEGGHAGCPVRCWRFRELHLHRGVDVHNELVRQRPFQILPPLAASGGRFILAPARSRTVSTTEVLGRPACCGTEIFRPSLGEASPSAQPPPEGAVAIAGAAHSGAPGGFGPRR